MNDRDPIARPASAADGMVTAEAPLLTTRRDRLAARGGGSLRVQAASGVIVNASFTIALQGLTMLRGFLVAIFVAPSEYGIWAIIVIGYMAIGRLTAVGIADKYIQQDDPDEELAFQKAFTLEAVRTGSLWLLLMLATPLLALAYRTPEIVAPGLVALLALPAAILQTPLWVYTREMDFKRQRRLGSVDPVVAVVVTVAAAVGGLGYWAFVAGSVAGAWAGAAVIVRRAPYPLRWRYDPATAREYVRFSVPVLLSNVSNAILLHGTTLFARAAVGLAGIGAMSLSNSLRLFTEFADGIVTSTMYPAISAVKERRDVLFESFVKSNRLALMWGAPVGIGVALFAADLVAYVLGERWTHAIALFQSVGLVSAIGHVGFNWSAYVRALGDTRPIATYAWITLIVWGAGPIPLLLTHGLRGYALGLAAAGVLTLVLRGYFIRRLFPAFALLPHAARALAPTVPAVGAVLGLRALAPESLAFAAGELLVYAFVTVATTSLVERALLREAMGYLRRVRSVR